jgi:hypothetical protein
MERSFSLVLSSNYTTKVAGIRKWTRQSLMKYGSEPITVADL